MFSHSPSKTLFIICLLLGLCLYSLSGGYFAQEIIVEISILAILALSLDLMAGYGGMVSLCHGALFGLAAYSFAAANLFLGLPPSLALMFGVLTPATVGLIIGFLSARVQGIFFIMVTLAFGQMLYVLIFDSALLGGDDGLGGIARLDLSRLGIDLQSPFVFSFYALFFLALTYSLIALILRSGFGHSLIGIHANETRMQAVGINTQIYKACTFGLSGMAAGMAGTIAAQHTQFVSPEMLFWTVSGEILIVLLLGGLGTLIGSVIGAIVLVFLRHEISAITSYWHFVIGIILIVTVLSGGRGLYGGLEKLCGFRKKVS